MKNIWTYVEWDAGHPTDISLQCLAKARELADQTGGSVTAVALGHQGEAETLIGRGADEVCVIDAGPLETYIPAAYGSALAQTLQQSSVDAIFFPASTQGNDLASWIAARLGLSSVLDCHGLSLEDETLLQTRLEYDNKVFTHYTGSAGKPQLVTLHDGIAEAIPFDESRQGRVQSTSVTIQDADLAAEVVNREIATKTVNLKDARIIVTGGAGVGTKENFGLIEELARVVGGEVGATRPVVDAGWTDYERQIGQTGTTVRPELYIACGVSGAVQHRVGMMHARKIVAINIDPNAPIFRFAHVKIVGDLTEVIPKRPP